MESQRKMAISPSFAGSKAPRPPDLSPAFYNLPEELLVMIMEQMLRLGEYSFCTSVRIDSSSYGIAEVVPAKCPISAG